jgi:hypothetical protein
VKPRHVHFIVRQLAVCYAVPSSRNCVCLDRLSSEAVFVLLGVPALGVLFESLAVDGTLEVLEAGLALDCLGRGILQRMISIRAVVKRCKVGVLQFSAARWDPSCHLCPCGRAFAVLWLRYP